MDRFGSSKIGDFSVVGGEGKGGVHTRGLTFLVQIAFFFHYFLFLLLPPSQALSFVHSTRW